MIEINSCPLCGSRDVEVTRQPDKIIVWCPQCHYKEIIIPLQGTTDALAH